MAARKSASRREILRLAGVGTAGLAVGAVLVARPPTPHLETGLERDADGDHGARAPTPNAKGYLADLAGAQLGDHRVESVGAIDRGGIPIEMTVIASGARFRVDVLRFDPTEGARGIGVPSAVSVYLVNGGKGRKPTDESLGLGAMALARVIARRQRAGEVPPSGLLTMGERAGLDTSDASLT